MVINVNNGIVTNIANVNFQDKTIKTLILIIKVILFLINNIIFPLTADLADYRSLVILDIISPFLYLLKNVRSNDKNYFNTSSLISLYIFS